MTDRRVLGTLGERLVSRRRRCFVGRETEVELFRSALESDERDLAVLYIHGPGGIGKTALLDIFAELAEDAGAAVVRVGAQDLIPSAMSALEALRNVGAAAGSLDRVVVVIDAYERLAPLDDWVRTQLLPQLPATALAVVAGRTPPSENWRADPGWRDLLRVVSLRNLTPDESLAYLRAGGVDTALHEHVLAVSHGHPLALSLLADVVSRGGEVPADSLPPNVVAALLGRFVDAVPSSLHRRALEVCALARVTNEAILRSALEIDDAHELYLWLRELSFVDVGRDGVFPHDLARDVLDADLRWRDPDAYKETFRRVRRCIHARLGRLSGREQQQAILDEKFVFRRLPGVLSPVDWDAWGRYYPEVAGRQDRQTILEMVRTSEGAESAAIAERWFDRQREGFFLVRSHDGEVRGFLGLVNLTDAAQHDVDADPGAAAAWSFAQRHAPPRTGENVTQCRFIVDAEAYQDPSPTLNAVPLLTLQRCLKTPRVAWDFVTLAEPDRWNEYFAVADLPRADGADFTVDGRCFGLFAHDYRRMPVDAWLELVTERALRADFTLAPPGHSAPVHTLSHEEFESAVRQALRDLRRPDLLARNPLLRTRVLLEHVETEPDAAALERLLRDAVASLSQHPRDDALLRAVDRTYLRPAGTQEAAAAALGLPFSTYRRHLTRGVARVVTWLWDREIFGQTEQQ